MGGFRGFCSCALSVGACRGAAMMQGYVAKASGQAIKTKKILLQVRSYGHVCDKSPTNSPAMYAGLAKYKTPTEAFKRYPTLVLKCYNDGNYVHIYTS